MFKSHVPPGEAASLVESIAWSISSDLDVICLCTEGSSGVEKKLVTIAEAICLMTRQHGTTEATMVDHDMTPMTKAGSTNFESLNIFALCSTNFDPFEPFE